MIRRPPRSTQGVSSAASDVYKRQIFAPGVFTPPTERSFTCSRKANWDDRNHAGFEVGDKISGPDYDMKGSWFAFEWNTPHKTKDQPYKGDRYSLMFFVVWMCVMSFVPATRRTPLPSYTHNDSHQGVTVCKIFNYQLHQLIPLMVIQTSKDSLSWCGLMIEKGCRDI